MQQSLPLTGAMALVPVIVKSQVRYIYPSRRVLDPDLSGYDSRIAPVSTFTSTRVGGSLTLTYQDDSRIAPVSTFTSTRVGGSWTPTYQDMTLV